jgi:hypothetical protein
LGAAHEDQVKSLAESKLDRKVRFMVRKELKKLPSLLEDGENLENLAQGLYEGNEGIVAVTDRRLLFVEEGVMRSRLEDFPFDRISSIQSEKNMLAGKLTVFAAGNKAEVDRVMPKDRVDEIADLVRSRISQSQNGAAPATSAAPDPVEQLRKLSELKDAGILTEEEFSAQKAKLLA